MDVVDKLAGEFSKTNSSNIGMAMEQLVTDAVSRRRSHERRWFDNNFFDDGYHFRVVSKKTGRVIDHVNTSNAYVERAIPRASRQIRAVSNLLFAAEPVPVVYPERMSVEQFTTPTGEFDPQAYAQKYKENKRVARLRGTWITTEWDELDMSLKLIDMLMLTAKNSISYMQIYSDTDKQEIVADVFDAFDVILYGDRRTLTQVPFITKTQQMDIIEAINNPLFDPAMAKKLTPDNRYATSEVKEAYMRARYGSKMGDQKRGTIIVKESFLKEVLTDSNWRDAVKKSDNNGALEGKSRGDGVMRHVYSAGGVTLRDEYIDYDDYPIVDLRLEPGLLYQVPLIERFIPQNKALDVIVTRLEKWVNAMVVGVYQKRKGENFQISNFAGGQVMEYETTPLTQMQMGSVGSTPFNVIELLNKYIDEQGSTTAGGIGVPAGVKSGVAIESVKATEYANLKISTLMLKKTIKQITQRMIERASKDYLEPHEVSHLQDGEPTYFDAIGKRGLDLSQKINKTLPNGVVSIDKDINFRIEIEPGLGLTMDGKRETMQQIINFMIQLAQPPVSAVSPDALKIVIKNFLDTYGFGGTSEFMEAMDQMPADQVGEQTIQQIKIAVLESMKEAGAVGPEMQNTLIQSTKVGVLETLKEAGMLDNQQKPQDAQKVSKSISFKDLPPEGQAQMAAQAGIQIAPEQIVTNEVNKNVMQKQVAAQTKQQNIQ